MSKAIDYKTPAALQRAGIDALVNKLGAVDAMRFIHLYDSGHGDYTKERHELYGDVSVGDVLDDMRKWKEKRQ